MRRFILGAFLSISIHSFADTPEFYARKGQIETGVPAGLTLAVAAHESGGNLSHKPKKCFDGSFDLGAGFNSRWVKWYAERFNGGEKIRTSDPVSILIVARILAWNHRTMGDWPRALTAYRRGQSWTKRNGIDTHYVDMIIKELADGPPLLLW
jgi:hypothetical protein